MIGRYRAVVALAFVVGVPILACSSSDSSGGSFCTSKGSCPNDTAPDQASRDGCNALLNDSKCGSAFKALGECSAANRECDANGVSQLKQGACASEQQTYNDCLASKDGGK